MLSKWSEGATGGSHQDIAGKGSRRHHRRGWRAGWRKGKVTTS